MEGTGHGGLTTAERDEAENRHSLKACANSNAETARPLLTGHLRWCRCSEKLTWRGWKRPRCSAGWAVGGRHGELWPALPPPTPGPTDTSCAPHSLTTGSHSSGTQGCRRWGWGRGDSPRTLVSSGKRFVS